MSCKKRGYVGTDGKPAFDWEGHEAARRNEREKEILLVECSCQKKKCSEQSNYKYRKGVFAVVLCGHV